MQDEETLEFCKQSLMDDSSVSSDDHNDDRNIDYAQEASEVNEHTLGNWIRSYSCSMGYIFPMY